METDESVVSPNVIPSPEDRKVVVQRLLWAARCPNGPEWGYVFNEKEKRYDLRTDPGGRLLGWTYQHGIGEI